MATRLSDLMPGVMNCATNVVKISPGEEVLILADTTTDVDIVDAYRIAYEITGGKVSVITIKADGAGASSNQITDNTLTGKWSKTVVGAMKGCDLFINLSGYADMHGLYGTCAKEFGMGMMDMWKNYKTKCLSVTISNKEALASDWATYPQPLFEYLNYKAHEHVLRASKGDMENAVIRVTDPQGTDIQLTGFSMCTKGEIQKSDEVPPFYAFGTAQVGLLPHEPVPNANGVIVATSIHTGYIPRMEATVQNGRVVNLKGGGEVSKAWMRDWERGKNATSAGRETPFGESKGPGINWLEEIMYGVHPRSFRLGYKYRYEGSESFHAWAGGTRRSGVLHFGIGGGKDKWYRHRDLEIFFPTLTINDEIIIDNGRLKVLDFPEVRKEAEKYGDPELLLEEKWIPEMPPAD